MKATATTATGDNPGRRERHVLLDCNVCQRKTRHTYKGPWPLLNKTLRLYLCTICGDSKTTEGGT